MALVLAVAGLEVRVSFHCWAQSRWCSSAVSPMSSPPCHLVIFLELSSLFLSYQFLYFEIVPINPPKLKKKSLYSVFGLEKCFSFLYILIAHWSVYSL